MEHQNWKVSYIIPKGKPAEEKKDTKGGTLRTNKKMPGKAPYLVDEESMSVPHVDHDLKMAIMQGRNAKGWTQTDLAQRLCVKPDVVKTYENGTAIPDNNFIAKMERVLECKLPRYKKH